MQRPDKSSAHPLGEVRDLRLCGQAARVLIRVEDLALVVRNVRVLAALRLARAALAHDQGLVGLGLMECKHVRVRSVRKAHDVERVGHWRAGTDG